MLADSLLACHSASVTAGQPLSLKVFVSGRGRLEDEGAIALADAFKVCLNCGFAFTYSHFREFISTFIGYMLCNCDIVKCKVLACI